MKKRNIIAAGVLVMLLLSACGAKEETKENTNTDKTENVEEVAFFSELQQEDTVILFITDVHHKLTNYIGYDGLMSAKKKVMTTQSKEDIIMVDCGDCLDGGDLGETSKGHGIAKIMDYVGVDIAVPGNHDFKYGVDVVSEIDTTYDFEYLSCNLREKSSEDLVLNAYTILEEDGKKIGFVGVSTPNNTFSYEGCTDFKNIEVQEGTYDLSEDCLFEQVQASVDQVKKEGAEYVIVVAHLGRDTETYGSYEMIKNTTGIDAVIDGHEHIEIEMEICQNANGEDVLLTAAGEYMGAVGKLVIHQDGSFSSSLLHMADYLEKDSDTTEFIEETVADFQQ